MELEKTKHNYRFLKSVDVLIDFLLGSLLHVPCSMIGKPIVRNALVSMDVLWSVMIVVVFAVSINSVKNWLVKLWNKYNNLFHSDDIRFSRKRRQLAVG